MSVRVRRSEGLAERNPYRELAGVYDQLYSGKDYEREAATVRELIRRHGPPGARTLLDVGCGTGEHLRHLLPEFEITGIDSSPEMLSAARHKLPAARFHLASMQRFRLRQRFDAILCLFSAIGYVRTRQGLRQTVRNLARHAKPGGIVLVEPWLTPDGFQPGSVHVLTRYSGPQKIMRMNFGERKGRVSLLTMHYLVGTSGGVEHWVDRHALGLFETAELLAEFRTAGFRARFERKGLTGRGLVIAVRSAPAGPRIRGPLRSQTEPRPALPSRRAGPRPAGRSARAPRAT